jgi:hypothetical protein
MELQVENIEYSEEEEKEEDKSFDTSSYEIKEWDQLEMDENILRGIYI